MHTCYFCPKRGLSTSTMLDIEESAVLVENQYNFMDMLACFVLPVSRHFLRQNVLCRDGGKLAVNYPRSRKSKTRSNCFVWSGFRGRCLASGNDLFWNSEKKRKWISSVLSFCWMEWTSRLFVLCELVTFVACRRRNAIAAFK